LAALPLSGNDNWRSRPAPRPYVASGPIAPFRLYAKTFPACPDQQASTELPDQSGSCQHQTCPASAALFENAATTHLCHVPQLRRSLKGRAKQKRNVQSYFCSCSNFAICGHPAKAAIQEKLKYGRASGTDFGPIDYIRYAEAFGATGLMIDKPDDIVPVMKKAFDTQGPVIVGVHVDYRDNHKLFKMLHEDSIH
jgi:hypothetical protein